MGWAYGAHEGGEGVDRFLVGKPEGKRPLGRPRRRWVDNITMDLQEVGCGYMDWIGLAQDRDRWRTLVGAVMNLRVLWNAGNFLTSCKPFSFSRRTRHHGVSKPVPRRSKDESFQKLWFKSALREDHVWSISQEEEGRMIDIWLPAAVGVKINYRRTLLCPDIPAPHPPPA